MGSKREYIIREKLNPALLLVLWVCFLCCKEQVASVAEESDTYSYYPYFERHGGNLRLAKLSRDSDLRITKDLPVMDGATSLYPVYAAFAQAVYPESVFWVKDDYVTDAGGMRMTGEHEGNPLYASRTRGAYENIISGKADIIFVAKPSEKQAKAARLAGVSLVFTPIIAEAFVFIVNKHNPINSLTEEQVRKIYTGEFTLWDDLGVGGLGKIRAFQRREGSGSQSAMIDFMGGAKLAEPKEKELILDMMRDMLEIVADYKNYKNAIGYSFHFYVTGMKSVGGVKLLSIDGVYPSEENMKNGKYHLKRIFFAVTRSDSNKSTLRLLEWIKGPQGKELIRNTGYIPVE